jgi:hypothetical protein
MMTLLESIQSLGRGRGFWQKPAETRREPIQLPEILRIDEEIRMPRMDQFGDELLGPPTNRRPEMSRANAGPKTQPPASQFGEARWSGADGFESPLVGQINHSQNFLPSGGGSPTHAPAALSKSRAIPDMHARRTTPAQARANIVSGVYDDEAVMDVAVDRVTEDLGL